MFTDFWINSYKHRKPLLRGLDALAIFGLPLDRMSLLKAWVLRATGKPLDDLDFSIHGLSKHICDHLTPQQMRLLGLPTRDRDELIYAIRSYREEIAALGPPDSRLGEIVCGDPLFERIASGV